MKPFPKTLITGRRYKMTLARSRVIIISTVILTILSFSNCVYYNTFYLAKKKYNEAYRSQQKNADGKANETNKKTYEEAIKKASKVLTFHPDSKYVDDALYLIGKAYYNSEEWRKSSRKFKELIVNFPESGYTGESTYLMGMCNFRLEDHKTADEAFRELISNPENSDFKDDGAFMLGEIRFAEEEYNDAIEYYRDMLTQYPKSDLKGKALAKIGDCYFKQGQYSEAKQQYDLAIKKGPDGDVRYHILFSSAECFYYLGEYKSGLKMFEDVKSDRKYFKKLAEIKLKVAEGQIHLNQNDKALEIFKEITVENPRTLESAQAYYEIGQIHEHKGELLLAKEAYLKGKDENRESQFAKLSLAKSSEIAKLESYRAALSSDSTGQNVVKTQLLLAEAMLMEFSQPDSAINEYMRILSDYPESFEAAQVYYALGYIYRNIEADTALADSFYIELAGRYPDSPYGLKAAEILGIIDSFPDSHNTEKMFARAENLLFDNNNPDSAILVYQELEADHPNTDYSARAAYAISYILDHYIAPSDSSAIFSYQDLIKKYPETAYANAAKLRLGLTSREQSRQKLGEIVQQDTSAVFDPADSTSYERAGFVMANTPNNMPELIWPPALVNEELKGTVYIKFHLDIFGTVSAVELKTTSGNVDLDNAIKDMMLRSSYDPQRMKFEELNKDYVYKYNFMSPAEAKKHSGGGLGGP